MSAKYILRLDDACHTMDVAKWDRIENLCDKFLIRPIIAVIPNNKDKKLIKDHIDINFWNKVRSWQDKGWHVALHGYDHVYISNNSGLVPFNNQSEFAGVNFDTQLEKIQKGINIFEREKIKTKIWVAPSHTFDQNTLKAIKLKTDIDIVCDGVSLNPFRRYGFKWLPQTLWHFRKMPFGLWTACIHPNELIDREFDELEKFIQINAKHFVDINKLKYKKWTVLNSLFSYFYWILRMVMRK
jgi:peptidoglycan/xylan/chitin deacetylase (PgdA/CDA1 family)